MKPMRPMESHHRLKEVGLPPHFLASQQQTQRGRHSDRRIREMMKEFFEDAQCFHGGETNRILLVCQLEIVLLTPLKKELAVEFILLEKEESIAVIQLNRPKAYNALNPGLMRELTETLQRLDADPSVGAIIITGNEKAFAAGADIKEMAPLSASEIRKADPIGVWDAVAKVKKPIIAAVSGFALGGGCELAMMCDIIIASETAQFGQPEINLGIIPGAGGTQRLTHAIGKFKAMDWILTGEIFSAAQAFQAGLVSRLVPAGEELITAKTLAKTIAAKGAVAVQHAKEAIHASLNNPLDTGLKKERELFYSLFDTADQKEGMTAFMEKRKPNFQGK